MTQPTALSVAPDLLTVAAGVLACLDKFIDWEASRGAKHLANLMPAFRRAVNGGELDPTRCPYDDRELEEFTDADEHGVFIGFQVRRNGAYVSRTEGR